MAEKGSLLMYSLLCEESHENCWYSQPLLQGMASGNLSMTNSILLSGDTFERIRARIELKILIFSVALHMIVCKIDTSFQQFIWYTMPIKNRSFLELLKKSLELTGDEKCIPPVYYVKHGTYKLIKSKSGGIFRF